MDMPSGCRIINFREHKTASLTTELIRFWTRQGALDEASARQRVDEVVCIIRSPAGDILGVSSAFPAIMPRLGGRTLWVYRNFLHPAVRGFDNFSLLFRHTAAALRRVVGDATSVVPEGVLFFSDDALERKCPDAFWQGPGLIYAGQSENGQPLRVHWLVEKAASTEPASGPDWYLQPVWQSVDATLAAEVMQFWEAEDAMAPAVARGRVVELVHVARDGSGRLAGVCTARLRHNRRLDLPLWYLRVFVGKAFRRSHIGLRLLYRSQELLEERYAAGLDTRGVGAFFELQYEPMKKTWPHPLWPGGRFAYIGDNRRGDHCRVQYFAGARRALR